MPREVEPKEPQPIRETESSISYLGVALEKAKDRGSAPHPEDYKDYISDEFSLELQKKLAVSWLQGDPILIEGGTSIGKSTTVKKMCAELGWEVHYANLNGATDVEDLMGRYIPNTQEKKKKGDPDYIFADGRVTSGLRQEEGKTKVIILDELNAASPNILIRLHEVLDAMERGGEVILSEDASEAVKVSKEKTKIVALMNPPGKGYLQRESLDPALLRRWVYQKEVTDLPPATLSNSVDVLFGLPSQAPKLEDERFLFSNEEATTRELLGEIEGIGEISAKYTEFHRGAKKLIESRKIAQDQPQPFTFDDREEPRRVRNFVARFYRGDVNKTFKDALRYYYAGKLLDPQDKAQLEELIRHVEYIPPRTESKRRGLEKGKTPSRQQSAETLLANPAVPDSIKERVRALESRLTTPEAGKTSMEDAERIMGANFLGPESIRDAFGIEIQEVPAIPFSQEELERAQELGQQLILLTDAAPDGMPLSMAKMKELREGRAADGARLLYKWEGESDQEWYEKETFFNDMAPTMGWRLVSPEIVPESNSKDYIDQSRVLADYLRNEVYKGIALPEKYEQAIAEFDAQKDELAELLDSDWEKAAQRLEELQFTKLTRESPAEAFYRLIVAEKKSGDKQLSSDWTWTRARSSDGRFVYVGYFDADGVPVYYDSPVYSLGPLGVCLSRS